MLTIVLFCAGLIILVLGIAIGVIIRDTQHLERNIAWTANHSGELQSCIEQSDKILNEETLCLK